MINRGNLLRPYIIILVIALVAWFPVVMLGFSLKNDALNLDLPFKYFISECIHNGVAPLWFNSWAGGYPLQSIFGWNIYNPLQFFLCSIFHYNLYTLQIEFMVYVCLSGWGMYHFLEQRFSIARGSLIALASCYMLSGFVVSSAQFLLFISATAFLPFIFNAFLNMVGRPGWKTACGFAVWFYVCLTSIYPPILIIACYSFGFIAIYKLAEPFRLNRASGVRVSRLAGFLFAGAIMALIISLPFLYHTRQVMEHVTRGHAIGSAAFLHSNYFHPASMLSFFFPLVAISRVYSNTDTTMQNIYCGLAAVLLLLPVMVAVIRRGDKQHWFYLLGLICCLLLSMDSHLPLRSMLNGFWGFRLFRSAAIFRLFSIFFLLSFLAKYFDEAMMMCRHFISRQMPALRIVTVLLGAGCLSCLLITILKLQQLHLNSPGSAQLYEVGNAVHWSFSVAMQLALLVGMLVTIQRSNRSAFYAIIVADVLLNSLVCMPFQAISSYRQAQIADMIRAVPGFPPNNHIPAGNTVFIDSKNNPFYNFNVFRKEVCAEQGYVGPVYLDRAQAIWKYGTGRPSSQLVYTDSGVARLASIRIISIEPNRVAFRYVSQTATSIHLLQNYFEGWEVTVNGQSAIIQHNDAPGMAVSVPPGDGNVVFRYSKPWLLWTAILLNAVVFLYFISILSIFMHNAVLKKQVISSHSSNFVS